MGSNSYPWGPHGPQSGPNQVTPNPTPSWVPQQIGGGGWAPSTPAPSGGGGNAGQVATVPWTPKPKSYVLGLILSAIFGPFGLFYASKKGALIVFLLMLAVPVALASMGAYGPAFHRQPLEIIGRDAVMNRFWTLAVFSSLIWAAIGVRGYNKKFKEGE